MTSRAPTRKPQGESQATLILITSKLAKAEFPIFAGQWAAGSRRPDPTAMPAIQRTQLGFFADLRLPSMRGAPMKRSPAKPKPDRLLLLTDRIDRLADQLADLADALTRLTETIDRETNNRSANECVR